MGLEAQGLQWLLSSQEMLLKKKIKAETLGFLGFLKKKRHKDWEELKKKNKNGFMKLCGFGFFFLWALYSSLGPFHLASGVPMTALFCLVSQ